MTAKECGRGLPGILGHCVVVFLFSRYIFRVFSNQTFPRNFVGINNNGKSLKFGEVQV